MSDTYQINELDEVVPYRAGLKCTDTITWRWATDLELEQRDEIVRLKGRVEGLTDSLTETLAEMESLMRTKPPYQGGLNIAERARHALSLYNDGGES